MCLSELPLIWSRNLFNSKRLHLKLAAFVDQTDVRNALAHRKADPRPFPDKVDLTVASPHASCRGRQLSKRDISRATKGGRAPRYQSGKAEYDSE